MLQFSPEDVASIKDVMEMLEAEAAKLGPESRIAALWSDWADLLRPAEAEGATDRALDLALEQVTPSRPTAGEQQEVLNS